MKKILDNQELLLISLDSLNFSNFIHTLYYAVQDHVIAPEIFERIKCEYLEELPDTEMKEDDRVIVKALTLISAEVPNENLEIYLQVLQAGAHEKKYIRDDRRVKILYTAGAVR